MSRIRGISRVNGNSRKNAETDISDRSYSARPAASVNVNRTKQVEALITVKRRMSIANVCESLQVCHCSTCNLEMSLCYLKVCAKWFPRMLINSTKKQRIVSGQKLQELSNEDITFLNRRVTWFHHYSPQSKRKSMIHQTKNFKTSCSRGKVMTLMFCHQKGVIYQRLTPVASLTILTPSIQDTASLS